ncbi:MAG: glycosyltransferase [Specibacter sp.]
MRIDHVLITRFNLPSAGVEQLVRAQEGWLRDRQALFERYCLPAVASQTEKNFHWVIYFDTQSPDWLLARVAELSRDGSFTPIYRDEVPHEVLLEDLRAVTGAGGDVLLTTNLDNDDGVAVDFVQRLQAAVRDQSRAALYVVNGLIQQGDKLYLRKDPVNAFCSVTESWQDPRTCWSDWHNKLGQTMTVRHIVGRPGWLQVIHTGNVSNRVRGSRVGPAKYRQYFAVGLSEVRQPGRWELVQDRLLLAPVRASKDAVRVGLKNLILKVGGKPALDAVKVIMAGGSTKSAH